jgi:Double zinc ribbon
VVVCPTCGRENPDGFAFCGDCAAPLAEERVPAVEEPLLGQGAPAPAS